MQKIVKSLIRYEMAVKIIGRALAFTGIVLMLLFYHDGGALRTLAVSLAIGGAVVLAGGLVLTLLKSIYKQPQAASDDEEEEAEP